MKRPVYSASISADSFDSGILELASGNLPLVPSFSYVIFVYI